MLASHFEKISWIFTQEHKTNYIRMLTSAHSVTVKKKNIKCPFNGNWIKNNKPIQWNTLQ